MIDSPTGVFEAEAQLDDDFNINRSGMFKSSTLEHRTSYVLLENLV